MCKHLTMGQHLFKILMLSGIPNITHSRNYGTVNHIVIKSTTDDRFLRIPYCLLMIIKLLHTLVVYFHVPICRPNDMLLLT